MTWGRLYWPFWIIVVSALFLGPELIALLTNWRNTLSNYAWTELNVTNARVPVHTVAWWFSLIGWLLAVFVLTAHIWYAKFR